MAQENGNAKTPNGALQPSSCPVYSSLLMAIIGLSEHRQAQESRELQTESTSAKEKPNEEQDGGGTWRPQLN